MKRLIGVAALAPLLVVAALPTSASAYTSEWTMGGEPLTEDGTVELTGEWAWTGGKSCTGLQIHATLTAESGTGHVESFGATECEPTETMTALGCVELVVTAEELPWMLDDEGSRMRISGLAMTEHYTGGPFCPEIVTVGDDGEGSLFFTPNNTAAISSGTFSGSVSTSLGTQTASGSGNVTLNGGTYGL